MQYFSDLNMKEQRSDNLFVKLRNVKKNVVVDIPSHFILLKATISSGLMGHMTCMQTL